MNACRVAEAAVLLGVSQKTIRRWLKRGHLPYLRFPSGQLRIPRASLEAILAVRREAPR